MALAAFAAGLVALVLFLIAEARSDHPMLDLTLFRRAPFAVLIVAAFLTQAAAFGYLPFSTVWLQQVLGNGPVDAGLYGALPMAAAALVVGAAARQFLQRIAPRWTVGLGLLLIAAGNLLQARIDADSTGAILIPGLIVAGLGAGCVLPSNASAVLAEVPPERSGMASGALNTFRQLGLALGVAVFGTVFTNRVADGHGSPGRIRRRAERDPAGRLRNGPGRRDPGARPGPQARHHPGRGTGPGTSEAFGRSIKALVPGSTHTRSWC